MLRVGAAIAGITVQVVLYYYLWRRLIANTELGERWHRRATAALIILGLSVPLTMAGARFISADIGQTVGWPVFFWIALAGIMTTLFGLIDLARISHRGARTLLRRVDAPPDPSRRAFVNRLVGGGAAAGAASAVGFGAYNALKTPGVVDVSVDLSRLPRELDGFKIVQLTDIHIGNTIGRGFVEDVVKRTNDARGDIVVITGDLVDGSVSKLADAAAPLADLKARHGVYFVTGNHEYYSGADAWIEHIRTLGIRVLRNACPLATTDTASIWRVSTTTARDDGRVMAPIWREPPAVAIPSASSCCSRISRARCTRRQSTASACSCLATPMAGRSGPGTTQPWPSKEACSRATRSTAPPSCT